MGFGRKRVCINVRKRIWRGGRRMDLNAGRGNVLMR